VKTLRLEIRRDQHNMILNPQFIIMTDGKRSYAPRFNAEARMFIGWLPYSTKRWELSNSKLRFKEYCLANGIRTPEFTTEPDKKMTNVVVKSNQSSFGDKIWGPYRSTAAHRLESEEFYEAFVQGRIAKIWFWNGEPVVMETQEHPFVFGTGTDKVSELLKRQMRHGERFVIEDLDTVAKEYRDYMGVSLDDIPPRGKKIPVDFRYGSPFYIRRFLEDVTFPSEKYMAVEQELRAAGSRLFEGIPADIRDNTVFTLDAVIDAENRLWCLEMNSNPFVHPAVYAPMISDQMVISGSPMGFPPPLTPMATH